MPKLCNRVLVQKNQAKGEERSFEIYNDKFIKVSIRSLVERRNYHLNLSMLEPWPSRQRCIAWPWLLASLYAFVTATAFALYLYAHPELSTAERIVPYIVVFVLMSLATTLTFLYRSPNAMVFRSRYGGVVLISVLFNNPDKAQFDSFIEELKQRILSASQQLRIDKRAMLDIELEELRRLTEERALADPEYERARLRALRMYA